jgi:hypothetical protein
VDAACGAEWNAGCAYNAFAPRPAAKPAVTAEGIRARKIEVIRVASDTASGRES